MPKTIQAVEQNLIPMKVVGVVGIDASEATPLPDNSSWTSPAADAFFAREEEELFSFLEAKKASSASRKR